MGSIDARFKIIINDVGDEVLCDFCNKDWSNSDQTGGFLFQSKAVCPDCEPRMLDRIEQYNEQFFIKGQCPGEQSFSGWIKSLRKL